MRSFDFQPRTRVVFGAGRFHQIGPLARELRFQRALIVSDPGIAATGLVDRAARLLQEQGIHPIPFHEFDANPDEQMIEAGRVRAASCGIDSILALGGGSSLDCAKGIAFVLSGGGTMREYRGYGKARNTLVPMLAVPTTAGTGSDAQSYAVISNADTHEKMACGDPQAAFRAAVLDPEVTVTLPRGVTAVSGFDAISHAVESYVTTRHSAISDLFAREAWRLLEANYDIVLAAPDDITARGAMLLGAHAAGAAIEQSMLGAAHACANPLTARFRVTHGVALAVLLPHVVRFNTPVVGDRYGDLLAVAGCEVPADPGLHLADRVERFARSGGLPSSLREVGVPSEAIEALAADAATQWTGTFNPRPFDAAAARHLYQQAY
jgi:alcohol dehydrogenase